MFKYKYYDRATAPMLFHKIFCFVLLPLSVIYTLGDISRLITYESLLSPGWYAFCLLIDGAAIVTCIIAAVGLVQWKEYGWYALYVNVFIRIAFNVFMIVYAWLFRVGNVASFIGGLLGTVIVSGPVLIYYLHRRPLFTKSGQVGGIREKSIYITPNDKTSEKTQSEKGIGITKDYVEILDTEDDVNESNKNLDIQCPVCNRNLPPDSIFCPYCGAELEKGIE